MTTTLSTWWKTLEISIKSKRLTTMRTFSEEDRVQNPQTGLIKTNFSEMMCLSSRNQQEGRGQKLEIYQEALMGQNRQVLILLKGLSWFSTLIFSVENRKQGKPKMTIKGMATRILMVHMIRDSDLDLMIMKSCRLTFTMMIFLTSFFRNCRVGEMLLVLLNLPNSLKESFLNHIKTMSISVKSPRQVQLRSQEATQPLLSLYLWAALLALLQESWKVATNTTTIENLTQAKPLRSLVTTTKSSSQEACQ